MKYPTWQKKRTKLRKYALIVLGAVTGLYLAFMGAYYATSTPGFCAACHRIKPYVQSWKQSPRQNVYCLHCHAQRGFLGKIESKTRGLSLSRMPSGDRS